MSRCVNCCRTKEDHVPEKGACRAFASMDLPEGETCSSCRNFGFCRDFLGEKIASNTTCDWYPIRFVYPARRGLSMSSIRHLSKPGCQSEAKT